MIAYSRQYGFKTLPRYSDNLQWFEQYKGKKEYRIEIYQKTGNRYKLIYHEN